MECPFCDIIVKKSERVLRETKYSYTALSNPRLVKGHMLVIPKRHVEKLADLSKEEKRDLLNEVLFIQERILEKITSGCDICQHYRPFIPNNRFKVAHLHIHLRPRSLDDDLYRSVQINESSLFKDLEDGEWGEYKELLS